MWRYWLVGVGASDKKLRLLAIVLVLCTSLTGCLQSGRPVVAEQSKKATPAGRSDRSGEVYQPADRSAERAPVSVSRPVTRTVKQNVSRSPEPVRGDRYIVRRGDTLYSIAWRHGMDPNRLAALNGIAAPYTIYPGQRLRMSGSVPAPAKPRVAQPATSNPARPTPSNPARPAPSTPAKPPPSGDWVWPVAGSPRTEFGRGSKGLDFRVSSESSIAAAQAGDVVYAGSGIGGYERLIIIKHRDDLLSAYSFNGRALVPEQSRVNGGQAVAQVRQAGRRSQVVHFELRRNGEPIDPREYLPKR